MPLTLIITDKAQDDVSKAHQWYEDKVTGLGKEFVQCIDARMQQIVRGSQQYPIIYADSVKRVLVARFPYAIFFIEKDSTIIVFAIIH